VLKHDGSVPTPPRNRRRAGAPEFIEPMMARAVPALPEGPQWLYELKLDGYRALVLKDGARVEIRSRRGTNLTASYPTVATAAKKLNAQSVVLDGEVVAVDGSGRPSFQALQHRGAHPGHEIVFYAFDVLHLNGADLTGERLEDRVLRVPAIVKDSGLLASLPLPGTVAEIAAAVRQLGLEGIIAKRRDSRYISGERSDAWQKFRLDQQQEFVVGGYRPGNHGVDALIVGYYDDGALRYAAKVRAGFTPHLRREVVARLRELHIAKCPFSELPNTKRSRWGAGITAEDMKEIQWVKPQQLVQIRFVEWTADGHLRHASFLGLRDDKNPQDVRREEPAS